MMLTLSKFDGDPYVVGMNGNSLDTRILDWLLWTGEIGAWHLHLQDLKCLQKQGDSQSTYFQKLIIEIK